MRVHVFQHVPFEGPGSVAEWAHARGAVLTVTPLFGPHSLPDLGAVDALVVLGGPMSVNDEARLPWLRDEKRFIGEAIASDIPVLGICLGAQLIAAALGARVYPGTEREIGWLPVYGLDYAEQAFRFPDVVDAFHWHGETFDLPPGATLLARSEACACQAFQSGSRTMGLQFHLETTPLSADALISHCRHELLPAPYVQSEQAIRAAPPAHYSRINALMAQVLDYLTRPD